MGNDALRSSRHSATSSSIRRSSRRHSKGGGQAYIAEDEIDRNNQEITQTPKPARRMDKIRRSLSFRRKKKSDKRSNKQSTDSTNLNNQTNNNNSNNLTTSASAPLTSNTQHTSSTSSTTNGNNIKSNSSHNTTTNPTSSTTNTNQTDSNHGSNKPPLWIEDEKRVRANNCSFQVKYLGSQEVTDSRGMHICEAAIEKLLTEKKKPIKAILYVSGDSLRVVDESNKTLLVDQTIEKVSFCAPDRHHENGFAYICRDGTTRRWLCHGFMAIKDTLKGTTSAGNIHGSSGGERLSHAVGCAFSVCLEKKQKRERENVSMEVGPNHSFTRLGSFRQASLTERLEDPQIVMPAAEPVPIKPVENPHAIERPKANPDAFNRQNPLRSSGALQMPFKRNTAAYTSLKPGELPSFQQQKIASGFGLSNASGSQSQQPITKTSLLMQQHQLQQQSQSNINSTSQIDPNSSNLSATTTNQVNNSLISKSDTSNKINTINELPEEQFQIENNSNQQQLTPLPATVTNSLSEQLNNQLSLQATPTNTNSQIEWPINQQMSQQQSTASYFQAATSSVFATPQSIPVTPSINTHTPPPLPPMPTQYTTNTAMLFQTPTNSTTAIASNNPINLQTTQFYQQQYQTYQPNTIVQFVPMQTMQQQYVISATPVQYQNQNIYPTSLTHSASLLASPSATTVIPTASISTSSSMRLANGNPNETFEQKWARIQAAKQTNPFAEDIAKKFEIKL